MEQNITSMLVIGDLTNRDLQKSELQVKTQKAAAAKLKEIQNLYLRLMDAVGDAYKLYGIYGDQLKTLSTMFNKPEPEFRYPDNVVSSFKTQPLQEVSTLLQNPDKIVEYMSYHKSNDGKRIYFDLKIDGIVYKNVDKAKIIKHRTNFNESFDILKNKTPEKQKNTVIIDQSPSKDDEMNTNNNFAKNNLIIDIPNNKIDLTSVITKDDVDKNKILAFYKI